MIPLLLGTDLDQACPDCFPGDHPAVTPSSVIADPSGSLLASYACPVCGKTWPCWWDASASGWPASTGRAA